MCGKIIGLGLFLIMLAGCVSNTRRTPALSAPPAAPPPTAPQKNFFKDVGDTTWRVVSAPAQIVTPQKKTKSPPQVYEAPTAEIITPSSGGAATTRPPGQP